VHKKAASLANQERRNSRGGVGHARAGTEKRLEPKNPETYGKKEEPQQEQTCSRPTAVAWAKLKNQ
jgi:hypothetical protein